MNCCGKATSWGSAWCASYGGPSLYGAIQEQMQLLDREDIPYSVVPGVSAVFAAAAALKQELTLPEVSQTVILTGSPGEPRCLKRSSCTRWQATVPPW